MKQLFTKEMIKKIIIGTLIVLGGFLGYKVSIEEQPKNIDNVNVSIVDTFIKE